MVKLAAVYQNAGTLRQMDPPSVDVVDHVSGQDQNKLGVLVPVSSAGIVGILREVISADINRIIAEIVMDFFRGGRGCGPGRSVHGGRNPFL